MTRNEAIQRAMMFERLAAVGFSYSEAATLRRISMTLHRWAELECGDGNDHASWCLTRGHKTGGVFTYDDNGRPFLEVHAHSENKARYRPMADRERGAMRRLGRLLAGKTLTAYVQGDPRGCVLYIVRPGDVPMGASVDSTYNNGIAVY